MTNLKAARTKLKWYRRYYTKHGKGVCASRRSRYALAEPKGSVIEVHVKKLQNQLLGTARAKLELVGAFKKQSKSGAKRLPRSMVKTVCLIAAKRLCNKALQLRRRSHLGVVSIDNALSAGDFHSLMEITKVHDFADLLTADLDSSYQQPADDVRTVSVPQSLETQLLITHAQTISDFEKQIDDDPVLPCCSCERLQQRKCVTRVSLSDNLDSKVWPALKAFMLEQNPDVNKQVLYMCNYCKPLIKQEILSAHCVLNGLQTIPVVRLAMYTAKVPMYNSLKACKGTMFFLCRSIKLLRL